MEIKQTSVKKNFIMNVILTMSSFIFPLITFPYIARVLGPEYNGKIQFATSIITYFTMFAQLGIPTYGIRAIAKVRDDKKELTRVTQELLFINLFMSLVTYIFLFFAVLFISRLNEEKMLYIIIGSTIFLSAIGMEWMYKGLEQYIYITVRSIIFKFIAMASMFVLVHAKSDYVVYGAITVFAASASNILNLINARKYISLKPIGNYNFKRHLKPVGIFFAMACATTIYTQLDTVMLGFIKGDYEVGIYNAAVKIKTVLVSIVTSLGVVLLPRASYYIEHEMKDDFKKVSSKALHFVLVFSIPLCFYFIMYAKQTIIFLSGNEYESSVLPMQVIMPTLVLIGITNILGIQMLIPLGKERIVLQSEIFGAITDLCINMVLIPKLGALGAAIGTLVAEFVVFLYQFMALKDYVIEDFRKIHYSYFIIGLLSGSSLCFFMRMIQLNIFVELMISSVCFFGAHFLCLSLLKEEFVLEIIGSLKNRISGM